MDLERLNELKACYDDARISSKRRVERLKDEYVEANAHDRVVDAVGDLFSEIDNLKDEVERLESDIDDLNEQLDAKQAECDDLRQQLLEAQNKHLESEKQQLESEKQQLVAEVNAKPMEIHNHFESGSTSQVFNDKVNGKFIKDKKDKKKDKKRWKKIVRKVL